jgi:hypothetical protein
MGCPAQDLGDPLGVLSSVSRTSPSASTSMSSAIARTPEPFHGAFGGDFFGEVADHAVQRDRTVLHDHADLGAAYARIAVELRENVGS